MKFKVACTVTFIWEEDSANWPDVEPTQEAILKHVNEYANQDMSYVFDGDDWTPSQIFVV